MHSCPSSTQEEEDLALAQALSASEAEYQQSQRQVSAAGSGVYARVGLILAWLGSWRGPPWVLLLLRSVQHHFSPQRAAQPAAVVMSLLEHTGPKA